MPRKPPSSSQLRSQLRQAERKATQDMKNAVKKAEREAKAEIRRSEQRMTSEMGNELSRAQRNVEREAERATDRQKRQISRAQPRRRISYTFSERAYLTSVRDAVDAESKTRDLERDAFLCHAWSDRRAAAAELYAALKQEGVDVWFSEEDLVLGASLPRQLDRGIARSRVGIVLVTPGMLEALRKGGFADQELGALLATGRVVPVCHNVSYEELNAESPLLASRTGLSTEDSTLQAVALKIADSLIRGA